jgi:hypothetical protein
MAVLAMAAAAVAWNYIPRDEVAVSNIQVGQPLLGETEWDTSDVYRITIEKFDRDLDSPARIELARKGGTWVIPGKEDFVAGNTERLSGVLSALRDLKILDVPSDPQNDVTAKDVDDAVRLLGRGDHEEFGVVQLSEAGDSRAGIGTLFSLEDARGNPLARVVVGKAAADASQRFVRLPGQPAVYLVALDASLLSTDFADWTTGDLLRLTGLQIPLHQLIESIEINRYFIDPQKLATGGAKTHVYQVRIWPDVTDSENVQWKYDLWPASEGQLADEPSVSGATIDRNVLAALVNEITTFRLRDVARKPANTAQALAEPAETAAARNFDWLTARGFRHSGFQWGQHQFDSLAGNIRLRFRNGNVDTLAIGNLAGMDMQDRTSINRYLLVTAAVDGSIVMPGDEDETSGGGDEPADDGESPGESAEGGKAAESNEGDAVAQEETAPAGNAKARQELLESARERARILNQVHADWLYVISQDSVGRLFPAAEALAAPSANLP